MFTLEGILCSQLQFDSDTQQKFFNELHKLLNEERFIADKVKEQYSNFKTSNSANCTNAEFEEVKHTNTNTINKHRKNTKIRITSFILYILLGIALAIWAFFYIMKPRLNNNLAINLPYGCVYKNTENPYYKCPSFDVYYKEYDSVWRYNVAHQQDLKKKDCNRLRGCTILRSVNNRINGFRSFKIVSLQKSGSTYSSDIHYYIELREGRILELQFIKHNGDSFDSDFEKTISSILNTLHQ